MKKNLTFVFVALLAITVKSQITLEKEYSESVIFAYLEGDCYYSVDFVNNQCAIYELGHASKKTVNIDVPTDWYLNDVAFISTNIFNDDNLIEMLVVYYRYVPLTDSTGYYEYQTKVINENGTVLLNVPGGGFSDIIKTGEGETKLMVYIYDFMIYPYTYNTNVYSLPGNPVSSNNEDQTIMLQDAYPNPSGSVVNIPYQVKSNFGGGTLIITDMNGRVIKRLPTENRAGQFILNTNDMAPGQYIYHIQNKGNRTAAKKFVVN